MKIYEVYATSHKASLSEDPVFVRDGFSLMAALFQPFWFLYYRLWNFALVLIAVHVVLAFIEVSLGVSKNIEICLNLLMFLSVGFFASDAHAWYLRNNGYILLGVVSGNSLPEAQRRFVDNQLQEAV